MTLLHWYRMFHVVPYAITCTTTMKARAMVDKPIYATCYRTNESKRPPHGTHPGVLFFMKAGRIRSKRPLSKQKCDKRPGGTVNAPPNIFLSKWPEAKLANPLSVRDGAVSETSKGMLYIGNSMLGMWVGTYFAQQ